MLQEITYIDQQTNTTPQTHTKKKISRSKRKIQQEKPIQYPSNKKRILCQCILIPPNNYPASFEFHMPYSFKDTA